MRVRKDTTREFHYDMNSVKPEPLKCDVPIFVVMDPGKTNMGCVIGTVSGQIIQFLEFSGTGEDTSVYCCEFKDYITHLVKNCKIEEFAQEKAIAKRDKDGNMVNKYFTSETVLLEIRALLINMAMEITGRHPDEINNWTWKANVLPDGFRSKTEKGSHRYLAGINPLFQRATADITDVVCMYLYKVKEYAAKHEIICYASEKPCAEYTCAIMDASFVPDTARRFAFNTKFSIEDNAAYFVNRCVSMGACPLDLTYLSYDAMFKYGSFLTPSSKPWLIVSSKRSQVVFQN